MPLLAKAVSQGISEGVFDCDSIPERVKLLLRISGEMFDEGDFTATDIAVFIEMTEKLLGAKKGTMDFIRQLIR